MSYNPNCDTCHELWENYLNFDGCDTCNDCFDEDRDTSNEEV